MLDNIDNIVKKLGFSKRVRICFGDENEPEKRVYRKMHWIIPIGEDKGKFLTLQNLTYDKMIGDVPLTNEEAQKYPIVINPEVPIKLKHNTYLEMDDPMDKIKVVLAYISGKIAIDKESYEGGNIHDGYFIDKDRNAQQAISIHEKKRAGYDIISNINSENLSVYCKVALLQKGARADDYEGLINETLQLQALYKQLDDNPDVILQLDENNNPNFKDQILISFAIKNNLIRRRGVEFYLEEDGVVTVPMGKTVNQAISYLREHISVRDNIMQHLTNLEPYYKEKTDILIFSDLSSSQLKESIWNAITGGRLKTAFDPERAEELLDVLYKGEGKSDDYKSLMSDYLKRKTEAVIDNIEKDVVNYTPKQIQGYNIRLKDESIGKDVSAILKMEQGDEYDDLLLSLRLRIKDLLIKSTNEKLQNDIDALNKE